MKAMGMLQPRFNIAVGQFIELDGRLLRFRNRGRDRERRLVFEGVDGVPAEMVDAEFLQAQMAGRLRLVGEEEAMARQSEPGRPRAILANDAQSGEEASRRLDYVRAWERAGCPARTEKALGPLVVNEFERRRANPRPGCKVVELHAPSARHVLRWIADWRNSGGSIEALIHQGANKGNRMNRLHPKAREIMTQTIEDKYLVDTKPTAVAVHAHVRAAIADYNAALPAPEQIPTPSIDATYRVIDMFDHYEVDFSRLGKRRAEHLWRPVMGSPATTRHNEAWEIDHTRVDLIVVDDVTRLPIGRPWVTMVLDRHTRMVMGFYIGFDGPGTYAVMECLRHAIMPKDDTLAKVDLKGTWPCFGTPEMLIPDQGREFKSLSFTNAMLSLGMDVQYTPVLKPWYKGRIERFFGTLTQDVFQRIPGTTFSNIFERNSEMTPDFVAIATIAELRYHTLRYLVEVYSQRRHHSLAGRAPIELWMESVALHGMRPLPDFKQVVAALSHSVDRKPQRQGIEFEGIFYNSPRVAAFRVRPGSSTVRIAVDANDLSRISFLDPADNQFHQVPIQPGLASLVAGRTLEQHRIARALQRSNPNDFAGSVGLARAYTVIDRAMEQKVSGKGTKNRLEAARHWDALTRARPPEEPPAFSVTASASPIIDGLFEDIGVPEDKKDGQPVEVPEVVVEPQAQPPAAKRARKPKAEVVAPAEVVGADDGDDLADIALRLGMTVRKDGE